MARFRERQATGSRALARRLANKSPRDQADRWRKQLRIAKRPGGAWDWPHGVAENARNAVPGLAEEFFREGDGAADAHGEYEILHEFRLRAKSFRYTLEVFAPAYGAQLKSKLEMLRELQDRIGAVNDCVVVLDLPEMDAMASHAVRRLLVKRERLLRQFWAETFSRKRRDEWIRMLARPKLSR
jgi:CHAD domain-containing protein